MSIRALLVVLGVALVIGAGVLWLAAEPPGDKVVHTVANAAKTDETQTTSEGAPSRSSETLTLAVLGLGLLTLFVGAFFDRVKSIGFPGGGSIELDPKAQAAIAGLIAPQTSDPETAERAYLEAVDTLGRQYWGKLAAPPESTLKQVAAAAVDKVS